MKPNFETDPRILEQLEKILPNSKFKPKKSWWPFYNRTCGLCGKQKSKYRAIDMNTGEENIAEIYICVDCGIAQKVPMYSPD